MIKLLLRHSLPFLLSLGSGLLIPAWAQQWTWMRGTATSSSNGVSGTMGVSDAANTPASKDGMATWTDAQGRFWIFSGYTVGVSSTNNAARSVTDLWRFDPVTTEWTWMKGSRTTNTSVYGTQGTPSATTQPPARYGAHSWTDLQGNLWLFGGDKADALSGSTLLSDLWRYNPTTNQWTWVGGSQNVGVAPVFGTQGTAAVANTPGARTDASTWTDAQGNFWLFGGIGQGSTATTKLLQNDLWRYSPATGQWTWMKGSQGDNAVGTYGTQGAPDNTLTPGARQSAHSWTDREGNLWLFGGVGYATNATRGVLNDLWRYNPTTNQWTWIKGTNTLNLAPTYGTLSVPASATTPGGRQAGASWVDTRGNFWLYGGTSATTPNGAIGTNVFADAWRYSPSTNQWTWMLGPNSRTTASVAVVSGTQGTAAAANTPGARMAAAGWIGPTGALWLFGGGDRANVVYNTLWHLYSPQVLPVTLTAFTARRLPEGSVQLQWATSYEKDNARFEVERQQLGSPAFVRIGEVAGRGSGLGSERYDFQDPAAVRSHTVYYRLKQVDYSGRATYSSVQVVGPLGQAAPQAAVVEAYPSVFSERLTLRLELPGQEPVRVRLTNMLGQTVLTQTLAQHVGEVSLPAAAQLTPGTYLLTVGWGTEQRVLKVVRQ